MRYLKRLRQQEPPTLDSLDAYDRWAANYPPVPHNPLMEAEQAAMLALLPNVTGYRVLDLACGSGRYSQVAAEEGARTVIGLDNSAPMLRAGQKAGVRAHFALATSEAIPLQTSTADLVICALALGHLPRLGPSLMEIARVLAPGGVALISDFHPTLYAGGARRTFAAPDGKTYAVEHYPHSHADYQAAVRNAGLHITAKREPTLTLHGQERAVVLVYALALQL